MTWNCKLKIFLFMPRVSRTLRLLAWTKCSNWTLSVLHVLAEPDLRVKAVTVRRCLNWQPKLSFYHLVSVHLSIGTKKLTTTWTWKSRLPSKTIVMSPAIMISVYSTHQVKHHFRFAIISLCTLRCWLVWTDWNNDFSSNVYSR